MDNTIKMIALDAKWLINKLLLKHARTATEIARHREFAANLRMYTFNEQSRLYDNGKLSMRDYLAFMIRHKSNKNTWRI